MNEIPVAVYVEQVIFDNLLINFSMLFFTSKLLDQKSKILRLIAAALIGAVYALLLLKIHILTHFILKLLLVLLMCLTAFKFKNIKNYIKVNLLFILVTIFCGGIVQFGINFLNSEIIIFNNLYFTNDGVQFSVIFLTSLLLILSGIIKDVYLKFKLDKEIDADIEIFLQSKSIQLKGFIDTGNSVTESSTELPVIFIKEKAADKLFDTKKINDKTLFITFSTINENGIVKGFLPDRVNIKYKEKQFDFKCVIGIIEKDMKIHKDAILHESVIQKYKEEE